MNAGNPDAPASLSGTRSGAIAARERCLLLVVDVQEKLTPHIFNQRQLTWNVERLLRGARLLQVAQVTTEQYPQGLGPSLPAVADQSTQVVSKRMFSCRECDSIMQLVRDQRLDQIVVAGMETHICVLQSVLDLLAEGLSLFVVTDAVGSRSKLDHQIALQRLETSGASLCTTESILFEWCETSTAPEFKELSRLVQEPFGNGVNA